MLWQVYHAKARFSELLDAALTNGPQIVTRRGVQTAVLLSIDEWKQLQQRAQPPIADPLLDTSAPHDLPVPARPALALRTFALDGRNE